jgi:hypothetical protein
VIRKKSIHGNFAEFRPRARSDERFRLVVARDGDWMIAIDWRGAMSV